MSNTKVIREARATLSVDVLIPDANGNLLVIRRGHAPYQGMWCWPGGMVDPGETVETTGIREVKEETGLAVEIDRVLGIYSAMGRDPRGHYISITLLAHPVQGKPQVTDEATELKWCAPNEELEMGFDHARIRADYKSLIAGEHGVVLA